LNNIELIDEINLLILFDK